MKIKHNGKINLALYLKGKRKDGYHLLDTIMQEIALFDILNIEKSKNLKLTTNIENLTTNTDNLIIKAYNAMKIYDIGPLHFHLEKNIPIGAGLGGGSANAAATIEAIDKIFSLHLSLKEKEDIGIQIGADVPYFFTGGTARAEGIGEKITPLPFYNTNLLIINDGTHVDTKKVYQKGPKISGNNTLNLIKELKLNKKTFNTANDLKETSFLIYPELKNTFEKVKDTKPATMNLSGTGGTIFAIYENDYDFNKAHYILSKNIKTVIKTHTIERG